MNHMNHMPAVDPDEELPKVEKLIFDLAWKFTKTYPIDFQEARREAYYAFVRACYDYNPSRGTKFSSWVYTWVWCHLKTLITKRTVEPLVFIEVKDEIFGEAAPDRSPTLDMIGDLSEDAKEIIKLLLETPGELLGSACTPKQLLHKVKNYLVGKGRPKAEVDKAHKEIVQKFREAWA